MKTRTIPISLIAGALLAAPAAFGQTYALDANPPIGYGAENPFGIALPPIFPPGFTPSPSLLLIPCKDSDVLQRNPTPLMPPALNALSPNGLYDDSLSDNAWISMQQYPANQLVQYRFSVDRLSNGAAGSAVSAQAALAQQPGDIYLTSDWFTSPAFYVGLMPAVGNYGGALVPAPHVPGAFSNTLLFDESTLDLQAGNVVIGPTVQSPVPPGPGTHDNLDQFDRQLMDTTGDLFNDTWEYFTLYPDEAFAIIGASPADIFDLQPLLVPVAWPRAAFAVFSTMGLEPEDSIDALVLFDRGTLGGPTFQGPGGEYGVDYALFSLAPGSTSLGLYGLSSADVFFTDFRNTFWQYAGGNEFGLIRSGGGGIMVGDNIDALEIRPPCPLDLDVSDDVGFSDILQIIAAWGNPGGPEDLNGNGVVDFADILVVIGGWGPCA